MTSTHPTGAGEVVVPSPLPPGRRAVLHAVRRLDDATAERVAGALGMSVSGARQHLAALVDDGLVTSTVVPRPPGAGGRRKLRYEISPDGDAHFPKAYDALSTELLALVEADGADAVDRLFERRRDARLAGILGRADADADLTSRVRELARAFDEEGYFSSVEHADDVVVLTHRNCAIAAVAHRYPQACAAELALISEVAGAPVTRIAHLVSGDDRCAFRIRPHG